MTSFGADYNVTMIRPSALPADAGVLIAARFQHYRPPHGGSFQLQEGLVQTSQQCTGS